MARKIVDFDKPLPDPLPKLHGGRLLIRPCKWENKVGSILIPDDAKDDIDFLTNVGQVIALGSLAYVEPKPDENRYGGEAWCKAGDFVIWNKYADKRFVFEDQVFVILNDDQILMTIDDPTKMNIERNLVKY